MPRIHHGIDHARATCRRRTSKVKGHCAEVMYKGLYKTAQAYCLRVG